MAFAPKCDMPTAMSTRCCHLLTLGGRNVVLLDDIASSGHTLASATRLLLAAGAHSVDVAVTHALFADDAMDVIQESGVRDIWSTDCVKHSTNSVSIAPAIAAALTVINWKSNRP